MDKTLFDQLTGVKVSAATTTQLNSSSAKSFIDTVSTEFWRTVIFLSRVLEASRTYAHGLVIPETGAVWTEEVANGATGSVQPSGTEIWRVESIDLDNCVGGFFDGTTFSPLPVAAPYNSPPFFITNTLYLAFNNGSGSSQDPSIAYSKVGL